MRDWFAALRRKAPAVQQDAERPIDQHDAERPTIEFSDLGDFVVTETYIADWHIDSTVLLAKLPPDVRDESRMFINFYLAWIFLMLVEAKHGVAAQKVVRQAINDRVLNLEATTPGMGVAMLGTLDRVFVSLEVSKSNFGQTFREKFRSGVRYTPAAAVPDMEVPATTLAAFALYSVLDKDSPAWWASTRAVWGFGEILSEALAAKYQHFVAVIATVS